MLEAIQADLTEDPERWPLVAGTGGARKGRVGESGRGKSGSWCGRWSRQLVANSTESAKVMPKSKQYLSDGAFSELMEGLEEVVEHAKGTRPDLRTTTFSIPDPPAPMGKDQIVELRTALRCSQAMFARALDVNKRTVEAWEQGLREPGDASLRLLEIARKHPSLMFGRVLRGQEVTVAMRSTTKKNTGKKRRAG